ncbi:NusG domain II-containing protein [Cloacibacillus sp.]|uniref:NusG domain II-containing protein n=1 Tax=Cloacibacillus sp. TaxID=2049023 RepID=UPI0025C41736|nr:NusG domain II-containing protein [Cloacibacillus sp.]MCC8058791.1 NusG domain II-containing protein [Cloacibacillus sp.]MCC8178386.1 NusG domain II-containing protein [Cloacibacillus sp.]
MRRGDRWMAAVTMAGAAMLIAGALLQQQRQYNEKAPLEAEIVLDGRVIETLPLTGPPREIRVDSAGTARGFNIIRAERGRIAVVSADCPDGACVRQGWIGRAGAGAVCLPHRLVVRIKDADRRVDGVSW